MPAVVLLDLLETARRALKHVMLGAIITAQLSAVVLLLGLPVLPTEWMVWAILVIGPALFMLVGMRGGPVQGEPGRLLWTAIGIGTWIFWGTAYFFAATIAGPAITLPEAIDWPLVPAMSLFYVGVHPLFPLPFLSLRSVERLRAHAEGAVMIVLLSTIGWVFMPVQMLRAPVDPAAGFGEWVLWVIHRVDPPTNCMPSTHCAMAIYAAIGVYREDRRLGGWAILTASLIALSVLLVHQHYLLDVVAGLGLGGAAAAWSGRRASQLANGEPEPEPIRVRP